MFNSYVKLAVRNLRKNKLPSFINLAGLSIAIGCSIVIFLLSDFMLTGNRNHEHARQIFMLENVVEENGEQQVWGDTPVPLGPALVADFPQVERAARVADRGATVQYGEPFFPSPWRATSSVSSISRSVSPSVFFFTRSPSSLASCFSVMCRSNARASRIESFASLRATAPASPKRR